jgi:hypothetical protein
VAVDDTGYSVYQHLFQGSDKQITLALVEKLRVDYFDYLNQSNMTISEIVDLMPQEWNVPTEAVRTKLIQLFDPQWTTSVWKNFTECLTENMNNHEI